MSSKATLIGTPVSPFVRKVMAVLAVKHIDYRIDPIVPFRNAAWARWTPDAARWPKATAWIGRVDAAQPLQAINAVADRLARTAPAQQPALARELGLAVTETSFGTVTPRRGPMTV